MAKGAGFQEDVEQGYRSSTKSVVGMAVGGASQLAFFSGRRNVWSPYKGFMCRWKIAWMEETPSREQKGNTVEYLNVLP